MGSCQYKKCQQFITEEFCSKISQPCDRVLRLLWKAFGLRPSGTVKIQNTSDCFMILIIKRSNDQKSIFAIIPPMSEKIFTVSCIISIHLACLGACKEEKCTGCIGLIIHYPQQECKKKQKQFCRQGIKQIVNS